MQKQPSSIIIYKRGNMYICDAKGAHGGGYSGASAGNTVEAAALFALREEQKYIKNNPEGGELHLPSEVREWINKSKEDYSADSINACKLALEALTGIQPCADTYLGQPSEGGINVSKALRDVIERSNA